MPLLEEVTTLCARLALFEDEFGDVCVEPCDCKECTMYDNFMILYFGLQRLRDFIADKEAEESSE